MSRRGGWLGALVAVALVAAPASAQEERALLGREANLQVTDVSLQEALAALQRASGVSLAYSPDLLQGEGRVSCMCRRASVQSALLRLLAGTDLVYEVQGSQVLIGRRPGSEVGDGMMSGTLQGVVVDEESGRPVSGADVVLSPDGRRVLTGSDGRFRYGEVAAGTRALSVVALGFSPRTLQVEVTPSSGPISVSLERRPLELAEIVIAPGSFGILESMPTTAGVHVSRDDIEAIPQLGDDVFRTLKRMPGVSADDISTRLNVRGGTDRDLLVRLDGLELYEPYHLRDLDGALGIVDVQSLSSVGLVTGGFPATMGDAVAGVFDMRTRTPPPGGTRTTVSLSLSSMSYNGQGTFSSERGQWVASLRRGFLEYVLAAGGVDDDISPTYWDALGKVRYLLSDKHSLVVQGLYAGDAMSFDDDESDLSIRSEWSSAYGWATWSASFTSWLSSETLVSAGRLVRHRDGVVRSAGRGAFTPVGADVDDRARSTFAGIRHGWRVELAPPLLLDTGVDHREAGASYGYRSEAAYADVDEDGLVYTRREERSESLAPESSATAAWLSLRAAPSQAVTLEAGARYDVYRNTDETFVSPRLSGRWEVVDGTTFRASWGLYRQSQGLHELAVQDGETTFSRAESARQVAVGIERRIGDVAARVEAYRRVIQRPRPEFVNLSREVNPLYEILADRRRLDPERARARGVELLVSQEGTGPLRWSASYTLASSEYLLQGDWVPRTLDQRHTLGLFGAYRLGDAWRMSASWHFHTGWPYTAQILDVVLGVDAEGRERVEVVRRGFGPLNRRRLPPYHRLDLRVTRSFEFRTSRLEVFLDVFNLYDRTNLRGYEWDLFGRDGRYSARRDAGEEQLPIMPTLGLRWVM